MLWLLFTLINVANAHLIGDMWRRLSHGVSQKINVWYFYYKIDRCNVVFIFLYLVFNMSLISFLHSFFSTSFNHRLNTFNLEKVVRSITLVKAMREVDRDRFLHPVLLEV